MCERAEEAHTHRPGTVEQVYFGAKIALSEKGALCLGRAWVGGEVLMHRRGAKQSNSK